MHSGSGAYLKTKRLNNYLIESGDIMTKKQKKNLIRIIASSIMIILLILLPTRGYLRFGLFMIPYLTIGYDIIIKAFKGVWNRQPFDECFLMTIATIGALIIAVTGDGDYLEAVAVMLFYQIGEWFQSYAVGKSRKNIGALMDIRPDYANIETEDGLEKTDPDDVEIGTIIVVQPGEKIPIDGIVVSGSCSVDTSALTGESVPASVKEGDEVISGCICLNGVLKIRTTKEFGESTASKILDLVENASSRKSRSENFITRFARIYTPAVVFGAIALAVIPPLFRMFILSSEPMFSDWIYRALTFLVISCPCALVISIPLSFFAGIGGAGREGILIKGSNYLEMLSKTGTVVFDKTGTLTKGVFEVTAVHPEIIDENELLHIAAHAERHSSHPIAVSLKNAFPDEKDDCLVENITEIAGQGITAYINGEKICVGNQKLMDAEGAVISDHVHDGTVVHVCRGGIYMGHIVISDVIKPESSEAVSRLRRIGVEKTVMLTGDSKNAGESAAGKIGIDVCYSELLPADKVAKVEELIAVNKSNKAVVFVGDGINDAPVLSRADIGIAMGAMGSDAAIEAADVVLMDDDPLKIPKAVRISKKCMRIVRENIWFSLIVKAVCLILGALGLANMWIAIFADVGVMVIAVLNAVRALFVKKL